MGVRRAVSGVAVTVGRAVTVRIGVGVGVIVGAGVSVGVVVSVGVIVLVTMSGGRVGAGSPGSRKVAQATALSSSMITLSSAKRLSGRCELAGMRFSLLAECAPGLDGGAANRLDHIRQAFDLGEDPRELLDIADFHR